MRWIRKRFSPAHCQLKLSAYFKLWTTACLILMANALASPSHSQQPSLPAPIAAFSFSESTINQASGTVTSSANSFELQLAPIGAAKPVSEPAVLLLRGDGFLSTKQPAEKLSRAIRSTGAVTVSLWCEPGKVDQSGPARIVTLSLSPTERNFTIGQDGNRFDVRFRTTKTSANGLPSLSTPSGTATRSRTHLVFTRASDGKTRIYLNGQLAAKGNANGTLANWNNKAKLALGNEVTGGRPWQGKLLNVSIYDRPISQPQVAMLFQQGHNPKPISPQELRLAKLEQHFRQSVAPVVAKNCLQCHDPATAEGDLILDQDSENFRELIDVDSLDENPFWLSILNDEMPKDRPPLQADEKQAIKRWLEDDAVWTEGQIDPADYQYNAQQPFFVRRLTTPEYIRSVRAAVGIDIAKAAKTQLPQDLRADGFQNTAYNLTVDLNHIETYNQLAKQIVAQMDVLAFVKPFGHRALLTDNEMRGLIQSMGTQILRGPLSDQEIDSLRGISTSVAAAGGDYEAACRATLQALLQSPRFLYRIENQDRRGAAAFLDDYEIANRLSYLVCGAPPDAPLLAAAKRGHLRDSDNIRRHVQRLLASPQAIEHSEDFLSQWLNLKHLDSLQPNEQRFPNWTPPLAAEMQTETLKFFRAVIWEEKRALTALLNTQYTFCTPRLAKHYGLSPQADGWQRYDLSKVAHRGGLLTHGSVLSIGGDEASMVTRGLFVLKELLRGTVNDPPPCVDTSPVAATANVSAREISEKRIQNQACGGCHQRFEPLAFGLEKFDGLGSFMQRDHHGNALREDGDILIPGTAKPLLFSTSAQLMDTLADHPRVHHTLVWKLCQFAKGRPLTSEDAPFVTQIAKQAAENGGTYQAVIEAMAVSPLILPGRRTP